MHESEFFQRLKVGETRFYQNTEPAEKENEWKTSITKFSWAPLKN